MNRTNTLPVTHHHAICPTHVGMNRPLCLMRQMLRHLPHARGDEPVRALELLGKHLDLPHARGDEPTSWSCAGQGLCICPTHVGMNRTVSLMLTHGKEICPTHVGMNLSS